MSQTDKGGDKLRPYSNSDGRGCTTLKGRTTEVALPHPNPLHRLERELSSRERSFCGAGLHDLKRSHYRCKGAIG